MQSDTIHTVRTKSGGTKAVSMYTKNKAIKVMCTECLGWGEGEPKKCTSKLCPLYPYRGKTLAAYD
jgi:hypothetical protein